MPTDDKLKARAAELLRTKGPWFEFHGFSIEAIVSVMVELAQREVERALKPLQDELAWHSGCRAALQAAEKRAEEAAQLAQVVGITADTYLKALDDCGAALAAERAKVEKLIGDNKELEELNTEFETELKFQKGVL